MMSDREERSIGPQQDLSAHARCSVVRLRSSKLRSVRLGYPFERIDDGGQ